MSLYFLNNQRLADYDGAKSMWILRLWLVVFLCLTSAVSSAREYEDPKCGPINYIRQDIPLVPIPAYTGTRYQDRVPDTLDMVDMANLSINALTCAVNANADYEHFFWVGFDSNPPRMINDVDDFYCTPKFMEALPLLRIITGSNFNEVVDRTWMDATLKSTGPDGLYYIPLEGRLWSRNKLPWARFIMKADGSLTGIGDPVLSQFTHPCINGRMLGVMSLYYLRDGNVIWKKTLERMVDRLSELAIHKDDYCYFPLLAYAPNAAKLDPHASEAAVPTDLSGEEVNRVAQGLMQCYRATGYKPALMLAGKLNRFLRFHCGYFDSEGRFIGEMHFHAHTAALLGMLEYALASDDRDLRDFVRKSYEWAKSKEAYGSTLAGYFPMYAQSGSSRTVFEACEAADMIALALKMSAVNVADYYEEAERWTRNHFVESQLSPANAKSLLRASKNFPTSDDTYQDITANVRRTGIANRETRDRVVERNIGAFAGLASGNDWGGGIMQCCTGNGARTIYYIWEHILDYKKGQLRVHMLLNRASPWADVYSYIPNEGRVDIKLKKDCDGVLVHAPAWIEAGSGKIKSLVDGEPYKHVSWDGRYVKFGALKRGKTVTIEFAVPEKTVTELMGGNQYTFAVKGNTIVSVEPAGGRFAPLYMREKYRGSLSWRTVDRFVSDKQIDW